jgi:uncharacterized membrane protein YfcA
MTDTFGQSEGNIGKTALCQFPVGGVIPCMNTLTIGLACLLLATFLSAGVVKGVTGMGLPTVAMGLLGTAMSPVAAAAILIVPSLVTNVWQMLAGPDKLRLIRRLWTMMLCIVIGTVLATRLLVIVDPVWSGRTLGLALIAYAAYALFSPTLLIPERLESWLSPVIGIVTGMVTGATGVFVIPAVPYVQGSSERRARAGPWPVVYRLHLCTCRRALRPRRVPA